MDTRNIDYKILSYTLIISIVLLFIPCIWNIEGGVLLGYPLPYLTIYNTIAYMKVNETILYYVKIDAMILFINIVIVYKCISVSVDKLKENE